MIINCWKFKFEKFPLKNSADQESTFPAKRHQTERVNSIRVIGRDLSKNFS